MILVDSIFSNLFELKEVIVHSTLLSEKDVNSKKPDNDLLKLYAKDIHK